MNNETSKLETINHKLGRNLLHINDWNEKKEIISFVKRLSNLKPILH